MDQSGWRPLTGSGGWQGRVATQPVDHAGAPHVRVYLDGSEPILVPWELLQDRPDGSFYLPIPREQLLQHSSSQGVRPESSRLEGSRGEGSRAVGTRAEGSGEELVVPVTVEEVDIRKRQWETGGVRVGIAVREREELVDEPLVREEVSVERVPVNQVVATAPGVRQEGNTTVIPVLEEVLVMEKRLVLKEEVRITKRRFEAHEPQRVVLKTEEPQIERLTPDQLSDEPRRVA